MKNFLFVFLGGGIGSVLRYALFLLVPSTTFPYATFTVNILGSFLIGFFVASFGIQTQTQTSNMSLLLFLTTGLCGGFTTFSAFSKEGYTLLQQQQWMLFFAYIFFSITLCIGGTALGFYLAR